MRIAVTIIGGGLTLVIALQEWLAPIGDGRWSDESHHAAGDAGWFIALLFLLGTSCAYGVPALAVTLFGLAGVLSLGFAANGGGEAFGVWGVMAFVLAVMSGVGWREQRRIVRRQLVHRVIDEELVPMDAGRPSRGVDSST